MIALLAGALTLGACASTRDSGPAGDAPVVSKLVGRATPEPLKAVALEPYAAPASPSCAELAALIAELDAMLGPDVDAKPAPHNRSQQAGDAAVDAAFGLIPYRGAFRFASGADRRDRERARAVLAGAARRGFLKGLAQARGCPRSAAVEGRRTPGR